MLEQVLQAITRGGLRRLDQLAEELGVTPALLEMMLRDLERMGHLRTAGGECASECSHCPAGHHCTVARPGQIWTLTDKGAQAARRLG